MWGESGQRCKYCEVKVILGVVVRGKGGMR